MTTIKQIVQAAKDAVRSTDGENYDDITRPARTALFDAANALDRLASSSDPQAARAAESAMPHVRKARDILFTGNRR